MQVKPTKYWRNEIDIHRLGTTPDPNGKEVVEVTDDVGAYLIQNNLAKVVTETIPEVQKSPPRVPPSIVENPQLEDWQLLILDYLTQSSVEQIDADISGIGPKTAEAIKNKGPLTWEMITETLSSTQINAVRKHVET